MYPPALWQMLFLVLGLYLAAYGPGSLLLRLLKLPLPSFPERLGVSCALGAVLLGWLGYFAVRLGTPALAWGSGWAAIGLGIIMAALEWRQGRESCDMAPRERALLLLGVFVGLGFAAGMNYWQLSYNADGSLSGRFIWPDALYRNAVFSRLMAMDKHLEWPWLAGEPLQGMSLFRFTALVPIFKALGLTGAAYQIASLWLGLFGVPVAACAAYALFRAFGANQLISAVAVLLTGILGNPRWLFNERFAHSPALHWAGQDVFALSVPIFFATLALIVWTLRAGNKAALPLAMLLLISGMGHIPWLGLALYAALPLYCLWALARRENGLIALALTGAALAGLAVLKLLMGSGTAQSPFWAALGLSPTIRQLSWAFPFLQEPLWPLLAEMSPTALLKLMKFIAVYAVAVGFYLAGSMWIRLLIVPYAYRFPWRRLAEPEYAFGLCLIIAGTLLSSLVNFNRLAYEGAQYDVYRVLWPALSLANLAMAWLLVEKWAYLRRGWGLLVLLVVLFYGSWENTQLVYWARVSLPVATISAEDMSALRYIAAHAPAKDIVFINPRTQIKIGFVGHNWGYVSGLLPVRVWLDNEDMARKFGQRKLWEQRWAEAEKAMSGSAEELARFLQRHGISWLMAQEEHLAKQAQAAGLYEAFRSGHVAVFRVAAASFAQ